MSVDLARTVEAGQPVVGDRRPLDGGRHPLTPPGRNTGIAMQRPEPHTDHAVAARLAGEDLPAAKSAEGLRQARFRSPGAQRTPACEQPHTRGRQDRIHGPRRARAALAARAVAIAGGREVLRDLELHGPAGAGPAQWRLGRWHARQLTLGTQTPRTG